MRKTTILLLLTSGALALSACSKKAPEGQLPPPPQDTAPPAPPPAQPSGPQPGSQADFLASVQSDTIHFDLDSSDVDDADRTILRSQAEWLQRYPNKRAPSRAIATSAARANTTSRWVSVAPIRRRTISPRWASTPRA